MLGQERAACDRHARQEQVRKGTGHPQAAVIRSRVENKGANPWEPRELAMLIASDREMDHARAHLFDTRDDADALRAFSGPPQRHEYAVRSKVWSQMR